MYQIMNSKMNDKTIHVNDLIRESQVARKLSRLVERWIPILLFLITSISVLTTIGIVYTFLTETIEFFKQVPMVDFFTGTVLKPLSQNPEFGILPLITGTVLSSMIAMMVAIPIGLMTAIYLSEYASDRIDRKSTCLNSSHV